MVLGLSGVGKSATINSLLGRPQPAGYRETGRVEVVRGEVNGIPLTFIDTPGLEPSAGGRRARARMARGRRVPAPITSQVSSHPDSCQIEAHRR